MGRMRLKPRRTVDLAVARMFGPEATRRIGERVLVKARANAVAAAKHSSVADRIEIGLHAHGVHTHVIMSVIGRDGSQIASHLEFGYFNEWLENKYGQNDGRAWMPGLHIMGNARVL